MPSYYESGKIARVATGTGPISWSHDKTMAGIWDLNGNVWEWQGGIRLVLGELQILANNDAADPDNPQNATSTCWKAINAADGALVDPESKTTDSSAHVSGKTVKLDYVNNKWTYSTSITNAKDESRSCAFYQVAADSSIGDAAKVMLRALALLPDSDVTTDVYEGDYMWWNNGVAERCVYRGGNWYIGSYAGVFFLNGNNSRSNSNTNIGFRSALVRYSGDSGDLDHLDDDPTDLSGAPDKLKATIKENADKLNQRDEAKSWPFPLPETLPGVVKLMLTKVLTEIYTAAGGKDLLTFEKMAYNASDEEIKETLRIASQLAQLNIAANAMRQAFEQTKLAMTTSITIKKEGDHE